MKTLHLSIITILVLVISITSNVYAQSSSAVSASLAKVEVGFFNMTETSPTIVISGIVYKVFSQNIVLTIFNPQNQLISVSQLQPGLNGTFSQSIIPSNPLWPQGNYTVRVASGSQNLTESVFYFPGIGCCKRIITPGVQGQLNNSTNYLLPPLKQFKSGITANDVKCKEGLRLMIKSEDGFPACVKPDTANILIERGWALDTNNLKLTHMNIKVFSSYTPSSLTDHFLTGSLYSSAEPIQNGNITITINGVVMGTTQTYPSGCFQFNNWNDSKLTDQINKSKSLGISSMELNFQTQYFGDSNHNPANASAIAYLGFYAVPFAPAQYDTEIYPSNQINVTQGGSAQFYITVKPLAKYWEVDHMKLNLQRMPCGLSYHILPVDNNDSVLVNNTASFDVILNTTRYTPSEKYWISIDQDLSGINEPNIGGNVGAFDLNVLKK